jgi:hypothetical protein
VENYLRGTLQGMSFFYLCRGLFLDYLLKMRV